MVTITAYKIIYQIINNLSISIYFVLYFSEQELSYITLMQFCEYSFSNLMATKSIVKYLFLRLHFDLSLQDIDICGGFTLSSLLRFLIYSAWSFVIGSNL